MCDFQQPHLVKPKSADSHFATPLPATPGETLGQSVNLIVVPTGKSQQLSDEFFQPSGALGKSDGSSGKQVSLGNQARTLVGVGLIGRDVDGLLAETLNETKADRRLFDQKGGGMVSALEVHDLSFQRVERKAATHDFQNEKDLLANQKNDSSRLVPGFGFTQSDVPADDDAIARLTGNLIIGREPLSLDDRAAGRDWVLLVLR